MMMRDNSRVALTSEAGECCKDKGGSAFYITIRNNFGKIYKLIFNTNDKWRAVTKALLWTIWGLVIIFKQVAVSLFCSSTFLIERQILRNRLFLPFILWNTSQAAELTWNKVPALSSSPSGLLGEPPSALWLRLLLYVKHFAAVTSDATFTVAAPVPATGPCLFTGPTTVTAALMLRYTRLTAAVSGWLFLKPRRRSHFMVEHFVVITTDDWFGDP